MDKDLQAALLAKAEARAKGRTEVRPFEVPGIGKMLFREPDEETILSFYDQLAEVSAPSDALMVSDEVIYACCPELHDETLRSDLGVTVPTDVVGALLDLSERDALGGKLFGWLGLVPESAEKTAKN